MPLRNNKQTRKNSKKKGKNSGGSDGGGKKNSVSQSAVQFVATENTNVICYHGSTIEKIDDPNFHKAHDAYFAFQVEYSDFLLNTSPDKKAMYGVKHDKFRDLHSAFDNENSEILKDPELAKYMFARALDDYNRSKKMVVADHDTIRGARVRLELELGIYLRYQFIPRSKGENTLHGSELFEKHRKYYQDIDVEVEDNIRGMVNVLARETPCSCMKDNCDKAKEEAKNTGKLGMCNNCWKSFKKDNLLQCRQYRSVKYCSKDCQKEDWSGHKKYCEHTHRDSIFIEIESKIVFPPHQ